MGATPEAIGWVMGFFSLATVLTRPLMGKLVGSRGESPVMWMGIIVVLLATRGRDPHQARGGSRPLLDRCGLRPVRVPRRFSGRRQTTTWIQRSTRTKSEICAAPQRPSLPVSHGFNAAFRQLPINPGKFSGAYIHPGRCGFGPFLLCDFFCGHYCASHHGKSDGPFWKTSLPEARVSPFIASWRFLLPAILCGAGMGLLFPAHNALAAGYGTREQKPAAMSFFTSVYDTGFITGAVFSGWIAQVWNLGGLFIVTGSIAVGGLLIVLFSPIRETAMRNPG
ncbi:MAG: hypothetical protein B1H13_10945 [Desulfobacteraceae bacterium 4484_190.3]|nr:MAG: hypothetical protein B1H13_10945 [Desulfobacteraceae bacterium 4484_190.3]